MFWTVTFSLTAIVVITGNLVTIGIFLITKLLQRPHFLLISLAIADMLVGALSVPLYIAVGIHPNNHLLILSFQCVDVFTGVISIFTLASISLERMFAIGWPLRHRTLTSNFLQVCHWYPVDRRFAGNFSPRASAFLCDITIGLLCHNKHILVNPSSVHIRGIFCDLEETQV